MGHLFEMVNGKYKKLLAQNEAGSQRTNLLGREIWNLRKSVAEKTRDGFETKSQAVGMVESQVLNSVSGRNAMSVEKRNRRIRKAMFRICPRYRWEIAHRV